MADLSARAEVARADEDLVAFGLALREALDAPGVTIREAIDQVAALRTKVTEAVDAITAAQTEAGVAKERLSVEHLGRTRAEMDRDAARAELEFVRQVVDAWQIGTAAPHDVLVAIRDRLARRTPGGPDRREVT